MRAAVRVPPAVAFVGCAFIWGTTWLAIKAGYGGLGALWGGSLRFLLAAALMLPFAFAVRAPWPRGREWFVVAFVGVWLFGVDYGFIYWGEQHIDSGLTAVVFATAPVFTAVFAPFVVPSERVTLRHLVALAVGLAGLVLVFQPSAGLSRASLAGMLAIVVSAAAAAGSSLVMRRWGRALHPAPLNVGAMAIGGVVLGATALLLGERPSLPATGAAWVSLGYLVVLGSVVAFLLYWRLLGAWPAQRASLVVLMTPIVALVAGSLAGERLDAVQWVGSLVVIASVAVALVPVRPRARAGSPAQPTQV